jgi:hypothetical protein
MESSEDNLLPGVDPDPDAYYPGEDEEDANIEEVPGLPTDEVDEDAPVEGEELARDEGEDGERFISPDDEEQLMSLKRRFFQLTGKQVEDFHDGGSVHSDQSER